MLTEVVKVRLTPDEKTAVVLVASKEQRSMSDWARLRLRIAAGLNGPVVPGGRAPKAEPTRHDESAGL